MRATTLAAILLLLPGCFFFPSRRAQPATAQSRGTGAAAQAAPPQPRPEFEHTTAEREAFIEEQTAGYKPVGEEVTGQLETFAPWQVELERGRCYRMVVRFAEDAELTEHARRGLAFVYESPGQPTVQGGPGVHGPGAVASAGCPQSERQATFDIRAIWGSATDDSRVHDLGTGGYTAQLYAKPISERELARQQAERERQIAEQRAYAEQRERERSAPARGAPAAQPSTPSVVHVTLRNRCGQSVDLFFGDKPKFGSGTYSSIGSNTVRSKSMRPGDMIWIVDDGRNGLSSVSVSPGIREIEILDSCTGFRVR